MSADVDCRILLIVLQQLVPWKQYMQDPEFRSLKPMECGAWRHGRHFMIKEVATALENLLAWNKVQTFFEINAF
jgi:hypothetical protein